MVRLQSFTGLIENFTDEAFQFYQIAGDAIFELCESASNPLDPTPDATQCRQASYLKANVTNFVTNPDISTYIALFLSLGQTVFHYSPWTAVLQQAEANQLLSGGGQGPPASSESSGILGAPISNSSITSKLIFAGPKTYIRGGVESNFTDKFDLLGSTNAWVYEDIASLNEQINYSFDEYVFVSDGVSGSMAAIFPFTASQLYNNRDRSNIETTVTLAAYGGLGNSDDFSISSFPASVQGVHLEDPIIGAAALQM